MEFQQQQQQQQQYHHPQPNAVQLVSAVISISILTASIRIYYSDRKKANNSSVGNKLWKPTKAPILTTRQWRQLHVLSQIIFQLVVFGGTLAECVAYAVMGSNYYDDTMLRHVVPILDHMVALPSLSLAALSGTALTHNFLYHAVVAGKAVTLLQIPVNIDSAVRLLNAFGVYWLIADKMTQFYGNRLHDNVFWMRLVINSGSCLLTLRLWWLMTTTNVKRGATKRTT